MQDVSEFMSQGRAVQHAGLTGGVLVGLIVAVILAGIGFVVGWMLF